jgi:LDH2 family malate/lactate/ureidoglycolate dehydrogenase
VGAPVRELLRTLRRSGPLWTASVVLDRVVPYDVLGLWPDRTVAPDLLARQAREILLAWGMPDEHASVTVEHILYADVHGIDSHGCGMLLHYHRGLLAGTLAMTARAEVIHETEATALVDGGGGLGHVPADVAMKLAIAKCRVAGVGAVAVRNSGHFGAAGVYAAMAAEAGFIGLATTSTEKPSVVPTLGLDAILGTNPIAFAAPADRNRPFLLDMATSTASLGKLLMAWRQGRPIPAGWAIDPSGVPVTDGRAAAEERRLTPLGGTPEMGSHKGYGLAAMVEILSSLLPGSRSAKGEVGAGSGIGHFFLAVDPRRFRGEGEFEADVDLFVDSLRASAPVDPSRPVLVPGDPEREAAESRRSGIPLTRSVVEDIRAVAFASGVPFILDRNG